MFRNIFSHPTSRNLFNNLFTKEYICYQNKLPKFSTNFKPKKSHQLITSINFSSKSIKYPAIFYSSLAAAIGYKIKFEDEKEGNEKLQYAINKGVLLLQRDKFDAAQTYFLEALNLAQQLNNIDGILLAFTSLAEIAVNKRQYEKGEQFLVDAKNFILQNGIPFDDPKAINTIINLGMTYELLKNYDKAKENYEFAYDVLEKQVIGTKNDDLDYLWTSLLSYYGNFLMMQSQQAEGDKKAELLQTGLSHLSKALNVWVDRNGKEREEAVIMYNELAIKYLSTGDADTAISLLKEAIEIGEKFPKSQVLPTALNNLGMVYLTKKMYDEAKFNCEESLRVARENSHSIAIEDAKRCLKEISNHMKNAK